MSSVNVDYVNVFHQLCDYDNLVSLCKDRLLQALELHLIDYMKEKIDDIIIDTTHEQVMEDLKPMMSDLISYLAGKEPDQVDGIDYLQNFNTISDSIYSCIDEQLNTFYREKQFIQREYDVEYSSSSMEPLFSKIDHTEMEKQIHYLQTVYQPDQRTDEWYEHRHNCITASSAWKILDTPRQQETYIKSKCEPVKRFTNSVNIELPFHHGHKYEPVSTMFYEKIHGTRVGDFGCIQHRKYEFIGASPDGINIDPDSEKYGILLEIKNVVSREITGIPKKDYWVQMQMQMEVCDLDYCDFLETKFVEYENEDAFLADIADIDSGSQSPDFLRNKNGQYVGLIVMFYVNDKPVYEYCPLDKTSPEAVLTWKDAIIDKYSNDGEGEGNDNERRSWTTNIYWKCERYSCICVERNRRWFDSALPVFERTWNIIKEKRKHAEPDSNQEIKSINLMNDKSTREKRRMPKHNTSSETLNSGVCMIDIIKLQ